MRVRAQIRLEKVQGVDQGPFLSHIPLEGEGERVHPAATRKNECAGVCSKFMKLFHFAPAFIADRRLKMNWFEAGLNRNIKESMSMHQYTSYIDLYDNAVNLERVMNDRNNYLNK